MIRISDLTVQFGGVVSIIGPNGTGKTNLIDTLSGFVTPMSGSVEVEEYDLLAHAPHQRARWGWPGRLRRFRPSGT